MKQSLFAMTLDELADQLIRAGFPGYRAAQIYHWLYHKNCNEIQAMGNLPLNLRNWLCDHFQCDFPNVVKEQGSTDGTTNKYLLQFDAETRVETVGMRYEFGYSVCVSSQAGCAMGCIFCTSTRNGLGRNLQAHEIVLQVLWHQRRLALQGQRVRSIVFMGSGEPLANYTAVMQAIHILHEPKGLNLGWRHFTVSTVGIPDGISRMAKEGLPVNLALSLHAPTESLRKKIIPCSESLSLEKLLLACDEYVKMTGRQITYEYTLIADYNDQRSQAEELAGLIRRHPGHVNLIPLNPGPDSTLRRPSTQTIQDFYALLRRRGISVTLRREMGADILAACGQLRGQTTDLN